MRGLRVALLSALGFGLGFPLVWMLLASLRPEADLFAGRWSRLGFEHYRALFAERRFWVPISNSLWVASITTAISVAIGTSAAYALARLRFRGRDALLALLLAVSLFPPVALVSPLFLLLREIGLVDTLTGLVLPDLTFALPLTVWLMAGYFKQLPASLEEAALIDGASRLRALWSIVLPVAFPGIAASAILTFVFAWNEFMFASVFTLGPKTQTVPVALALLRGRYQVPWGQVLAAAVVGTLPVIVLVLTLARRIENSLLPRTR
jgi:ABC-type glycerol-3-phosphate transport system permease component